MLFLQTLYRFLSILRAVCFKLLTSYFGKINVDHRVFTAYDQDTKTPTNFDRSTFGSMHDEWAKSISIILLSFCFISESRNIEFVMSYLWYSSCQLTFIFTKYGKLFQLSDNWVSSVLLPFDFYSAMIEKLSWLFWVVGWCYMHYGDLERCQRLSKCHSN